MKKSLATLATTLLIATGLVALPAAAQADVLDPRITFALEAEPGGVLIDPYTVIWPELGMQLTIPDPRLRGTSTKCPSGHVCAFQQTAENGAKLSWPSCGSHSTAALGAIRSIANRRPSGTLQARNGTTVVATAAVGQYTDIAAGTVVTNIYC